MTNNINILAVKDKKAKNIVMYEVNDANRQHEYDGTKYIESFISFMESLGFQIQEPTYTGSHNIIINGVEFGIDTDHASFMARSAYDKKGHERKPENRYIAIAKGGYNGKSVVKIHFNKEIESEKIKEKINGAITAYHNKEKELFDRIQQDEENTIAIGTHYLSNQCLKEAIDYIHIEKGIISFSFKEYFTVQFINNNFVKANFYVNEMDSDAVFLFIDTIGQKSQAFETAFHELLLSKKLPDNLIEWANTQYHRYFYSKTMSTNKTTI